MTSGVKTLRTVSWCDFEVVGESHYQDALAAVLDREGDGVSAHVKAVIEADPTNPYDRNAVRVSIAGRTVAHLCREDAQQLMRFLRLNGASDHRHVCPAYVVGRFDTDNGPATIGLKLGLCWPPELVGD